MITTAVISEILKNKSNTTWSISPTATVFEAIHMMADKNIGAIHVGINLFLWSTDGW